MNKTDLVEKAFLRTDLPEFRPGDSVKVHVRVVEGNRERVQVFQGVVIRRQGGGLRETFTVRKISFGVGVERTFPVHSPSIARLEIVSRGAVRRAKLYYLRDLRGKKARIKERRIDEMKRAAMEAATALAAVADADTPEEDRNGGTGVPELEDEGAGEGAETAEAGSGTSEAAEEAGAPADGGSDDGEVAGEGAEPTDEPEAEPAAMAEERAEG